MREKKFVKSDDFPCVFLILLFLWHKPSLSGFENEGREKRRWRKKIYLIVCVRCVRKLWEEKLYKNSPRVFRVIHEKNIFNAHGLVWTWLTGQYTNKFINLMTILPDRGHRPQKPHKYTKFSVSIINAINMFA